MEHLEDDKKAVVELYRVLKKGGTLLVSVPNINFPFLWDPLNWMLMKLFNIHVNKNTWWLAGIWADHERLYSEYDIKKLLNFKFKILNFKLVVSWCWPFTHFLLYGIGKNIVERLGVTEFSRFTIKKTRGAAYYLARFMALPNSIFPVSSYSKTSAGIFIHARK